MVMPSINCLCVKRKTRKVGMVTRVVPAISCGHLDDVELVFEDRQPHLHRPHALRIGH